MPEDGHLRFSSMSHLPPPTDEPFEERDELLPSRTVGFHRQRDKLLGGWRNKIAFRMQSVKKLGIFAVLTFPKSPAVQDSGTAGSVVT